MFLLSWMPMFNSSIMIVLLQLWAIKAPFNTGLNGASPKLLFCVYFCLTSAPTLYGPGRRKTLVGRGGAGRDALGKAAAHDLRAAAASFACRGLPGQENCSGRCANIAVRAAPLPAQGPLPTIYGQRRHHSLAAGCRVKRIAADGARISPCAQHRRARRGFDDAAVARIGLQGDGDNSKLMI